MTILKHQKLLLNYCCRGRNGSRSRPHDISNLQEKHTCKKRSVKESYSKILKESESKRKGKERMNEIPESNLEHTAPGGRESLNHKEVFCVRSFCSSTRDRERERDSRG
jgi:hypothetical protein